MKNKAIAWHQTRAQTGRMAIGTATTYSIDSSQKTLSILWRGAILASDIDVENSYIILNQDEDNG